MSVSDAGPARPTTVLAHRRQARRSEARRPAGGRIRAVDVPRPTPDTVPTPPPTPDIDDPSVPPEVVEPPPQPGEHEPVGDPRSPASGASATPAGRPA